MKTARKNTMTVIAMVNQKGGAGKSTLSMTISSLAASEYGQKVATLDLDPQMSILELNEKRSKQSSTNKSNPKIAPMALKKLQQVLDKLREQGYSLIILDTQGADDIYIREIMKLATFAIVPVPPGEVSYGPSSETIKRLNAIGRPFRVVFTRMPPRHQKALKSLVRELVKRTGLKLPLIKTILHTSIQYDYAAEKGKTITEYAPKGKHAAEVRKLFEELMEFSRELHKEEWAVA